MKKYPSDGTVPKNNLFKGEDISSVRDKDSFYGTITNNLQIGVYLVQDGKIKFANKHISKYSGYEQRDLLGADITKFGFLAVSSG